MTSWLGIFINLLPLLVFFGLLVGAMKFARVRPRYQMQGLNLMTTYGKRRSDVIALDRAARVVRGYPLGSSWFRTGVFVDVLDTTGRLVIRFSSPCISPAELRAVLEPLRHNVPTLDVAPEVEEIVRTQAWPRSSLQRLLPLVIVPIIGAFFAINFLSTLVRGTH